MINPPSNKAIYKTTSIPAPVGGLNARDSIANMVPTDAVIMENLFPQTTSVDIRNGYTTWQEGLPGWVETVMEYNGFAVKKLFAASVTEFYDVTQQNSAPVSVVSGLSNAEWQYTNAGTAGGQYLYCVNGTDFPQLYNGTSWQQVTTTSSPIALTGVDPSSLVNITLHKERLWFIQKFTCSIWYLDAGAIGGALSQLDLTQLFNLGGYIVAMMSWSVDGVGAINDYAAFITSEGEVAVYDGIDPNSADTWKLIGRFRIGRPIGWRPFVKVAGDINLITADGIYPLSKALMEDRDDLKDAVSAKIVNLINQDVASYGNNYGWQVVLHPLGNKLIVNVPMAEKNTYYQYVMNTITKAWTKFTGWNAICWTVQKDNLYFGGSGAVYLADTGQNDNGTDIQTKVKPAFGYFDTPGQNKMFTMVRPIFITPGVIRPVISLNVDFSDRLPTSTPAYSSSGSPWDTSPWDTSPWSSNNTVQANWQTVGGVGKAATIYMKMDSQGQSVSWQATDYLYQMGGIL